MTSSSNASLGKSCSSTAGQLLETSNSSKFGACNRQSPTHHIKTRQYIGQKRASRLTRLTASMSMYTAKETLAYDSPDPEVESMFYNPLLRPITIQAPRIVTGMFRFTLLRGSSRVASAR